MCISISFLSDKRVSRGYYYSDISIVFLSGRYLPLAVCQHCVMSEDSDLRTASSQQHSQEEEKEVFSQVGSVSTSSVSRYIKLLLLI